MESIFGLLALLFNITLVGGLVLLTIRILKFRKKSDLKDDVDNLQAQISLLRISMKSRVKKKSHTFRSQFPKGPSSGDLIDVALNELIENKLESGKDLQAYFDLSRRINSFIGVNVDGYAPAEDFMSNDFTNEISIIKLIKEICALSTKLNVKIDAYNLANPNAKISTVDPIIFQSMSEVNRIFSSNQNVIEDLEAKKPAA